VDALDEKVIGLGIALTKVCPGSTIYKIVGDNIQRCAAYPYDAETGTFIVENRESTTKETSFVANYGQYKEVFYNTLGAAEMTLKIKKNLFKYDLIQGNLGDIVFYASCSVKESHIKQCTIVGIEEEKENQNRRYTLDPRDGSGLFRVGGDDCCVFFDEDDAGIYLGINVAEIA
jgi:hypothetical protein